MCGITGILNLDGASAAFPLLQQMTTMLTHRGPDGDGFFVDGPIGLGHRRLRIIDLSERGKQPLSNEGGTIWVTFNGEIYNYRELRADLTRRGHVFYSNTDTEVVVHAFEEEGIACLNRFNGMFAFGLWDARQRKLYLARDRIGIKPLFYYLDGKRLLFASEIKAILCHQALERRVNLKALHAFLSLNYTPAPYTLFEGVKQLLPGHYLVCDSAGNVSDHKYWDLEYVSDDACSEEECVARFQELLQEAVRKRLMSDVPFGAFLSGGLDSSSIVYCMAQCLDAPVKTFSIAFTEDSYNESEYARAVARRCRTQHHERVVRPDAVEVLPKIVWHAEEPTADSSMIPMYYLAQMARERVTMALSGDGADETLAGYETYQAYYLARLYRLLPGWVRQRLLAPLVDALPVSDDKVSWDFKLKRFVRGAGLGDERGHAYWRIIFDEEAKRLLYRSEMREALCDEETFDLYKAYFDKTNGWHALDRLLYVDTRFYLPNDMLVKIDRMTMAHGLEARVPFLDHELVEFLATVPPRFKLRRLMQKKHLLKRALQGRLPRQVLSRSKQGFNVPKGIWIKNELKAFVADTLSRRNMLAMGLFEPNVVADLLTEHWRGQKDNSHQIWGLLVLTLWWQQFQVSTAIR